MTMHIMIKQLKIKDTKKNLKASKETYTSTECVWVVYVLYACISVWWFETSWISPHSVQEPDANGPIFFKVLKFKKNFWNSISYIQLKHSLKTKVKVFSGKSKFVLQRTKVSSSGWRKMTPNRNYSFKIKS